jgi:hypothetical protein
MATDPAETLRSVAQDAPQAPLAGSRSQSIQRLQVGLFGLAAMVLLVALANIIRNNADQNEASVVPEAAPTVAEQKQDDAASDPLADAGVVPDMPADQPGGGNAAPPQP